MGLDMYWFAGKTPEEKAEALITGDESEERTEIGYFRKFYALNDFMGTLYQNVDDFNCVDLAVDEAVLQAMKRFVVDHKAKSTGEAEDLRSLKYIVIPAIERALSEGRPVVYWPWW